MRARKEWLEWFRVDRDVVEHTKTYDLAAQGGWSTDKALGRLIRLWAWVAKHAADGKLTRAISLGLDNHMIDHEHISDHPESLSECCCPEPQITDEEKTRYGSRLAPFVVAGFLDPTDDGGFIVHDWANMNGYSLRERERDRERKSLQSINSVGIPAEVPRKSRGIPENSRGNGDGTDTVLESESKTAASAPPRSAISFPTKRNGTYTLSEEQVSKLESRHLAVPVRAELLKALSWVEADSVRLKTMRGMPRFIVGWLNRYKPSSNGNGEHVSSTLWRPELIR